MSFQRLYELFAENGFSLYLVGGTVRDYLLNLPLTDLDVVSDATPKEMKMFLPKANYVFAKYGSVKLIYDNFKFDITTLRKEDDYVDSRHPNKIRFCKSLKEDVYRRDFTINALYMDHNGKIYDYVNGQADIENKVIRVVGNIDKKMTEDPLRMVRAIRFSISLGFKIDDELFTYIYQNKTLLQKLNIAKIKQEINKCSDKEKIILYLNELGVLC